MNSIGTTTQPNHLELMRSIASLEETMEKLSGLRNLISDGVTAPRGESPVDDKQHSLVSALNCAPEQIFVLSKKMNDIIDGIESLLFKGNKSMDVQT